MYEYTLKFKQRVNKGNVYGKDKRWFGRKLTYTTIRVGVPKIEHNRILSRSLRLCMKIP
jgi:hypothetical protein